MIHVKSPSQHLELLNLGSGVSLKTVSGEWTKWTSNAGYVNSQATGTVLYAFSHWTWAHTKGEVLVCDLQEVWWNDHYILTDPVICSNGQIYDETYLGVVGMAHFFNTHKCTSFCSRLPKSSNFSDYFTENLVYVSPPTPHIRLKMTFRCQITWKWKSRSD